MIVRESRAGNGLVLGGVYVRSSDCATGTKGSVVGSSGCHQEER